MDEDYVCYFTIMIILAIGSFTLIAYYLLIPKRDMPHNKCHTDKLKIDDLHGHTEPHV